MRLRTALHQIKWVTAIPLILCAACGPHRSTMKLPQGRFQIVAIEWPHTEQISDYKMQQEVLSRGVVNIDGHKLSILGEHWDTFLKYTLECSLESNGKYGSISFGSAKDEGEEFILGIFKIENGLVHLCYNERPTDGPPTSFIPRPLTYDVFLSIRQIQE